MSEHAQGVVVLALFVGVHLAVGLWILWRTSRDHKADRDGWS